MGFFDAIIGSKPVQGAQPSSAQPPKLSTGSKEWLKTAVEVGKRTGEDEKPSLLDRAKMLGGLANVTSEDHDTLRQHSADIMKKSLTPATLDPQTAHAAKGLIGMIDSGMLPMTNGQPAVWIKGGKPATPDEMNAGRAKGWAAP